MKPKAEFDDMTQMTTSWRPDPLTWGKGPRALFLEPTGMVQPDISGVDSVSD